jgi:hypothetical protein
MKTSTRRFLVGLALCTLLPIATTSAEDKVTRPFKMSAHSQMVVDLNSTGCDPMYPFVGCAYEAHAEGVATHLGQVTAHEEGLVGQVTGGDMTAANGDVLFYVFDPGTYVVTITGGTGRFEGAIGEVALDVVPGGDPLFDGAHMILKFIWTGSGTITY